MWLVDSSMERKSAGKQVKSHHFPDFSHLIFLLEVKGEQGQLDECPERKGGPVMWHSHS